MMNNDFLMQLMNSGNPQQMAMQMLQAKAKNNPMLQNVMQMAQNGNGAGIEQVARNLAKSRGVDADALMKNILQMKK